MWIILESTAYSIFLYLIVFLFTLSLIITIHELGHYYAAKICRVRITQFSVGFGKELWGITRGHTRYSVGALPIGGFVKLFGDTDPSNPTLWDEDKKEPRSLTAEELDAAYCTKSIWQRAFIISAGPGINILFSIFIISMVCMTIGKRQSPAEITAVAHGSPAYEAGIQINDVILQMDGKNIEHINEIYKVTFDEDPPQQHCYLIQRNQLIKEICYEATSLNYLSDKGVKRQHNQTGMVRLEKVKFEDIKAINNVIIENDKDAKSIIINNLDNKLNLTLQFKKNEQTTYDIVFPKAYNKHLLKEHLTINEQAQEDVAYTRPRDHYTYKQLAPLPAVQSALIYIKNNIKESYLLLEASFAGRNEQQVFGGVGAMSEKTAASYSTGLYEYFSFVAALSLMIAVINLLPIPALDGGYLAFIIVEAIRGKPISPRLQDLLLLIGLVTLGGIMIWANMHDMISHLSSP